MPLARPTYSVEAEDQAKALFQHYDHLGRVDAVRNLARALADAETRIAHRPEAGLRAPRP